MLSVNFRDDEVLQDVIKRIFSALLPTDVWEPDCFGEVLMMFHKYIKSEELEMEWKVLDNVFMDLQKISSANLDYEPQLLRSSLEKMLEIKMYDSVLRPEYRVKDWLEYQGRTSNLQIETVRTEACQILCQRTLDLYDECMDLNVSAKEVISEESALREAFINNVARQFSIQSNEILSSGKLRTWHKEFIGSEGWLEYGLKEMVGIKNRLDNADASNEITVRDEEDAFNLLSQIAEFSVPIADWGIPELDDATPILQRRLVVVVGQENIGKTKFAIHSAVKVLLAKQPVVYMSGETSKPIMYGQILINYIWQRSLQDHPDWPDGYNLTMSDLASFQTWSNEEFGEMKRDVGRYIMEVSQIGLTITEQFNYETLYQELVDTYEKHQPGMIVIDHSCALKGKVGDGSLREKVSKLAVDCRDFKKNYPTCVLVTSHPSSAGKDMAKKDKNANDSVTKGSQDLSTEADEVFYLRDNEGLQKQNLLVLENVKRRGAGRAKNVFLRKKFEVNAFIYDESKNSPVGELQILKDEALTGIQSVIDSISGNW